MKNIFIFILTVFCIISINSLSFAQSKSTNPTSSVTQQQIDELKSKIASKVAELNLVEKRGVLGTVTDSSGTQITLTDVNGDIKNIDVDELTKFYSNTVSFGISDIKKGQTLGILGLFNKESRRLLAREINDIAPPQNIILGIISNIDRNNYEITITKENGKKYIFEIQDTTKTFSFISDALLKTGFSKMQSSQTAIAMGLTDKQSPGKILASRIILLPEIALTSKIITPTQRTIIPSTSSGLKLTPITK
jgi:hypothetical protein